MSVTFVAHAQQWSGENDPYATHEVFAAHSFDNKLWLLDGGDASQGSKGNALRLKTWDANSWHEYPEYNMPSGVDSIRGGEFLGVDTFIYVAYQSFTNGMSRASLLRFDILSEKWNEISSFDAKLDYGSKIHALAWFNNELYIAGDLISFSGENQLIRVIHDFAFAESFGEVSGSVGYMSTYQGFLYFGGSFDSIGLEGAMGPIKNMAAMQDDIFTAYPSGEIAFLKSLKSGEFVFQEVRGPEEKYLNLLSASPDQIMNHDFPKSFEILDYAIYEKHHFAIQTSPVERYGPGVYRFDELNQTWVSIKTKLNPLRSKFVQAGKNIYLVELSENSYHLEVLGMSYLGGRVFVDIDGDCAKTAGDRMIDDGLFVKDNANGRLWYTEPGTGIFGAYIGDSAYDLDIPNLPLRLSTKVCANGLQGTLDNGDSIFVDIPLSIIDTTPLVHITITSPRGFRARQGFEEEYTLTIYNEGFRVQNCPITLKMPQEIQFVGADIMPIDSGADGTYTWKLQIAPFEQKEIHLTGSVELTTPSYTKVTLSAWSDSACLRASNKDSLVLKVVGAFDPNDKQNFPDSLITKKTKEIRYHIRFQNTGTDTALNVWVRDTIDTKLPLAFVKLDDQSHFYTLDPTLLSDGVLYFQFKGIMLPDSGTNLEASNGYISYHVGLTNELKHGDIITNRAYIYFDYQHPIETNMVQNEMQDDESSIPIAGPDDPYLVYPNPSKGHFNVVNFTEFESTCILYDAQGKALGTWTVKAEGERELDLTRLSPGIYFLRFPGWSTQETLVITQ